MRYFSFLGEGENMRNQLWVGVIGGALLAGCGGGGANEFDTVNVSGTVYLDDQPHGPATLTLFPSEPMHPSVSGDVAADGTFTLTTYDIGDGAPPGDYAVELSGAAATGDASTDPAAMMAAMSGGGSAESVSITIPEGGSDNLEIRFQSSAESGASSSSLLGR